MIAILPANLHRGHGGGGGGVQVGGGGQEEGGTAEQAAPGLSINMPAAAIATWFISPTLPGPAQPSGILYFVEGLALNRSIQQLFMSKCPHY